MNLLFEVILCGLSILVNINEKAKNSTMPYIACTAKMSIIINGILFDSTRASVALSMRLIISNINVPPIISL